MEDECHVLDQQLAAVVEEPVQGQCPTRCVQELSDVRDIGCSNPASAAISNILSFRTSKPSAQPTGAAAGLDYRLVL